MKLPKDEQRSDWSTRPLTQSQAQLRGGRRPLPDPARRDPGEGAARCEAARRGRTRSSRRSSAGSGASASSTSSATCASRARASSTPTGLSVLRELYLMRDQKAREIDRPPFKVLGNRTLIEIAERQPKKLGGARRDQGHHRPADPAPRARRAGRGARRARVGARSDSEARAASGRRRMDRHAERRLRRAEAVAHAPRGRAGDGPGRAVPELDARGDRRARPPHGAADLDEPARAQALVRARVRRRGRARRSRRVDSAPRED